MILKFSYSVEITQCQFKCETDQFDEGYLSETQMTKQERCKICQKLFDTENIKAHVFSCERREEQEQRRRRQETLARSGFPKRHLSHNKFRHNFLSRVKFKTMRSRNKDTLSPKTFQNLNSELPLDFGYEEQLKFKIQNYILSFKEICNGVEPVTSLPKLMPDEAIYQAKTTCKDGQICQLATTCKDEQLCQLAAICKDGRASGLTQSREEASMASRPAATSLVSNPAEEQDSSNNSFIEDWFQECENEFHKGMSSSSSPTSLSSSSSSSSPTKSQTNMVCEDQSLTFPTEKCSEDDECEKEFSPIFCPVEEYSEYIPIFSSELEYSAELEGIGKTKHLSSLHSEGCLTTGKLPKPTSFMLGSNPFGGTGLRHSPPPTKGPIQNNQNNGNNFNDRGGGSDGGSGEGGGGGGGGSGNRRDMF